MKHFHEEEDEEEKYFPEIVKSENIILLKYLPFMK